MVPPCFTPEFSRMAFPRASKALSRFTVLDLTRVRAGPTCARQFADRGANVIKIDAMMEDGGEALGGPRRGADFQNLHRNKRAMALNLKNARGVEVFMLDFQAARWLVEKDVAPQAGNNHPTSIPTGVFKTSDGYINIAATGGRIWERLCQTLGAPEWIDNPDYATAPARSKNRDAL